MDPLLEILLGKFNLSDEVVLTIENNGKKAYLKGTIAAIKEKYLYLSTNGSVVRVSPESILKVAKPQISPQRKNIKTSTKQLSDRGTSSPMKSDTTQKSLCGNTHPPKVLKSSSIEPVRLNKFLTNVGVCSRKKADELILAGMITINGVVVHELGIKVRCYFLQDIF